jgi:hypothetical protein
LDEEFRRWSKVLSPEGPAIAPRPFTSHDAPAPPVEAQPFPFKQPQPTKP